MWVKLAVFHPKARDAIRDFPEDVQVNSAQSSLICKRVRSSQCRCHDRWLRLNQSLRNCASGTVPARIEFSTTRSWLISVLIFHAFAKKTQKTPPHEIALAQKRLKEMLDEES